MTIDIEPDAGAQGFHEVRRRLLLSGLVGGAAFAMSQNTQAQEKTPSAGPIKAGRGSQLTGKVAVVTGAARGIGRAIAVEMAANGADIAAIDICGFVSTASNAKPATPEDLEETARQVRGLGRRCTAIKADIRDIDALRKAADQIEGAHGKIDILVANAAIQRWKSLLEMDDADWRDVIDNNLNGTANTIRAFAPKMVGRGYGRIIVLSSMQGKHGTKDGSSYSASKWGILGLMKSAAMELGPHGVTVNALIPGLVDTPLTRYPKRFSEFDRRDAPQSPSRSEPPGGMERARTNRAAAGGMAAAGRHLARSGVSCL